LEYFGQVDAPSCGECDVCKEKEHEVEVRKYKAIQLEVKNGLAAEEKTIYDLVKDSKHSEAKFLEVIRIMMDNGELESTSDNKIRLT